MSKKLRYEETDQQFNDLPVPDQETSWQKMKQLLDDDDDRIVPPPIFFKSCLGWGLLLTGLIVALLVVRPEKWFSENAKSEQTSSKTRKQTTKTTTIEKQDIRSKPFNGANKPNTVIISEKAKGDLVKPLTSGSSAVTVSSTLIDENSTSRPTKDEKPFSEKNNLDNAVVTERSRDVTVNDSRKNIGADTSTTKVGQVITEDALASIVPPQDSTTAKSPSDSANQAISLDSAVQKKVEPKRKFVFAAGIGEQQQIPIAGQTAVPYSHYGRKGSLADYIPSAFVRLQKENKWFVQAEFRYGAAQSVKEFSFARKTTLDSNFNVTTKSQRLKKTYYHQLPFSFNYYLRPALSVGAGGIYSRFYRAVTEQETKVENALTGTQTVFKQIVPIKHFTDSFLYKTQLHVLLQADYHWKKFSFGLRYSKDVQPYIKYTRPDGTVDEEKNQSLQFIIRYRLWQSRML